MAAVLQLYSQTPLEYDLPVGNVKEVGNDLAEVSCKLWSPCLVDRDWIPLAVAVQKLP